MTNFQRAVAVRALYNAALYAIGSSIATYEASDKLKEAVVSSETIGLLEKSFQRIPSMFSRFTAHLDNEEVLNALDQLRYMISSLQSIITQISSYKAILKSHKNDVSITKSDFSALVKLEALAAQQLKELKIELLDFTNLEEA